MVDQAETVAASSDPAASSKHKPSLLEDLHRLAATVLPSEIPDHFHRDQVLAALIKTLDHAGLTVAEDLFPKPVEQIAPLVEAEAPAAATAVVDELSQLLQRARDAVDKLEGHPVVKASPTAASAGSVSAPSEPAPSTSAPAEEPSSTPAPAEASGSSIPWSPASGSSIPWSSPPAA